MIGRSARRSDFFAPLGTEREKGLGPYGEPNVWTVHSLRSSRNENDW